MKINAITNTNFKGLFTDKSKENYGDWRMEYQPYSWENKMANKVRVDFFSSSLPDNEELYSEGGNKKISRDILGTVSYFDDRSNGRDIKRTTITEMPAMDLENSLRVKRAKLLRFSEYKSSMMDQYKNNISQQEAKMDNIKYEFARYANDIDKSWGNHDYSKEHRADGVRKNFNLALAVGAEKNKAFTNYALLAESQNAVWQTIGGIDEELEKISSAKTAKRLIDVSRQDVEKPLEPLITALQDISAAKNKLVALPRRTITVSEIIKAVGENFSVEKAIKFVETLIKHK